MNQQIILTLRHRAPPGFTLWTQQGKKRRRGGQMWLQLITCGSSARWVGAHMCECVCLRACVCVSPFDVICVSCVVPLQLLVHIKQDDHWSNEIHRLPSGQQVKVGATVATTVAITGVSPGSRNNMRASEDSSKGQSGQLKRLKKSRSVHGPHVPSDLISD